jgi:hypothetical protein
MELVKKPMDSKSDVYPLNHIGNLNKMNQFLNEIGKRVVSSLASGSGREIAKNRLKLPLNAKTEKAEDF